MVNNIAEIRIRISVRSAWNEAEVPKNPGPVRKDNMAVLLPVKIHEC
jgi:hypothetical protein